MRLTLWLKLVLTVILTGMVAACANQPAAETPESTRPPTVVPPTAEPATPAPPPTATATAAPTALPTPVPVALSGRVLWGTAPVAGAVVELRAPDWRITGDETALVSVRAGAAGQYLLVGIPPGEYSVVAVWPDEMPSAGGTPAVVLEPGQSVSDLTLKLEKPLTLLEPDIGQPVPTLPTILWEPLAGIDRYRVWIIDKGTTEAVVETVVTGDRLDVVDQLQPSRDYTLVVSGRSDSDDPLADVTVDFVTAETPTPPRAVVLPAVCAQPGLPTYIDRAIGLCFAYPADHIMTGDPDGATITGPAVSTGAVYFPSLTVTERSAAGEPLAAWVDSYLAEFGEAAAAVGRIPSAVAGVSAEILEPVPGDLNARQVAVVHGSNVLLLSFAPTFGDIPTAEQDFLQRRAQTASDNLFETALATAAFLPSPGSVTEGGIELPAACVSDGLGLYVDADAGLCFAIPTGFTAQRTPQGLPRLLGPALDESLSPVRATFALEPLAASDGRSLADIVGDYLAAVGDDDSTQTDITIGGEAAVLLENLPGGRGSQEVFAVRDGQAVHLVFQPDPDRIPDAEEDMTRLMEAVLGSFAFLPPEE